MIGFVFEQDCLRWQAKRSPWHQPAGVAIGMLDEKLLDQASKLVIGQRKTGFKGSGGGRGRSIHLLPPLPWALKNIYPLPGTSAAPCQALPRDTDNTCQFTRTSLRHPIKLRDLHYLGNATFQKTALLLRCCLNNSFGNSVY